MKQIYIFKIAIFSFLMIINFAKAADIPKLSLTVDNQNPLPGSTITFTAKFDDSDEITNAIFLSQAIAGVRLRSKEGINQFDKTYPYQWTISFPNSASGIDEYQVDTLFGSEPIASNVITITVKPDLQTLNQIYFDPGDLLLMFPGDSDQLVVMGRFTDGYNREITKQVLGVTYTENVVDGLTVSAGNSPVISISEDGLVTALQPGVAEVVATNNGISNVRRIEVIANDSEPEDNIPGDFDSDGDVDQDDLNVMRGQFGTNATGSDDPYDMNKDGVINVLDFRQAIRLCTRPRCAPL